MLLLPAAPCISVHHQPVWMTNLPNGLRTFWFIEHHLVCVIVIENVVAKMQLETNILGFLLRKKYTLLFLCHSSKRLLRCTYLPVNTME